MSTAHQYSSISPMMLKPTISFVTVTPEIAQRWLEGNTVNRSIRQGKVDQYASDMAAGLWTHSADTICFTPDGKLGNGQHRLLGVIQSNTTITFAVQYNVPLEAMVNVDTGSARTASDILGWNNEKNAGLLASSAKLALLYSDGRIYKDARVQATSHGAILVFIDANPELRHSVAVALRVYQRVDCYPSVLAVAHWIITCANNSDVADHFLNQLATLTGESQGSAVLALDRRFREIRRARAKHPRREILALIIKGWNYYAAGKAVDKLHITTRGTFRVPPARQCTTS
jgi:hypothetical protein